MDNLFVKLWVIAGVVVSIYYFVKFYKGYGATMRHYEGPLFHIHPTKFQRITLLALATIILIASIVLISYLINWL